MGLFIAFVALCVFLPKTACLGGGIDVLESLRKKHGASLYRSMRQKIIQISSVLSQHRECRPERGFKFRLLKKKKKNSNHNNTNVI